MKFAAQSVLLVSLAATFAHAQTNLPQVQHVIIVIQENRTPTNLFQQDQTLINNGAHIASQGSCGHGLFNLQPAPLGTCWDPDHSHSHSPKQGFEGAWKTMWDNGAMDGACNIYVYGVSSGVCVPTPPPCPDTNYPFCAAMTYAQNTAFDGVHSILDPYFQIANRYGFANYMFQTNQGASFPAHQFLFTGTSAPIYDDGDQNDFWKSFDGENTNGQTNGCIANYGVHAYDIDPGSNESLAYTPPPPVNSLGFPCYDHPTLATLLDNAQPSISWRYYGRSQAGLWTAPTAINRICHTTGYGDQGGQCNGQDWINYVKSVLPVQGNDSDQAPFLTNITNCSLPQVSWVIPDGNWSDHNQALPGDGGPSWAAAIVNAIGQNAACPGTGEVYWNDTVILITWDDWGGFYDDVSPASAAGGPGIGYSNTTGKQYVYGFRVPLLVVSAYAKPSYISGANAFPPDCAHKTYCHDFGSILNFIEWAFGQNGQPLGTIGDPRYPYADSLAPDAPPTCLTCTYSLADFFNFSQFHSFATPITGAKYPPSCFHDPDEPGCFTNYPQDPDNDANED